MSLRFFADQCVPHSVIQALRDVGHDVSVLREHIPGDSDDAAVIAKAQELNAILVSLNAGAGVAGQDAEKGGVPSPIAEGSAR